MPLVALIVFALGASVGSFLNVVADRVPAGQSLLRPRSHCPGCKRLIPNSELIPVANYIALRGKCRQCGARIPVRVFWVEVITGILFAAVFFLYGFGVQFSVIASCVAVLVVVAIIDLEHRLILNKIVLPAGVVLLAMSPLWPSLGFERPFLLWEGAGGSVASSLAAGFGAFALFMAMAIIYPAGMGGGDVKLAGIIGLMVGFPAVLLGLWVAVIAGGSVAVALILTRRKGRKDAIPFGPFLSMGGIVALLIGPDLVQAYLDLTIGY